jgi:arylsulfatase A-like enzyme
VLFSRMQLRTVWVSCWVVLLASSSACAQRPQRNVVIFVADGLRHGAVDTSYMPTFAELRKNGVDFVNSHSLFPTVTTVNASAIATGHYIGDTGNFGNELFTGYLNGSDFSPDVENNVHLADFNAHFEGNYLGEVTLIAAAREAGMHTAVVGKHGPTLIQDVTRNNKDITASNVQTIVIDDATGSAVARNGDRNGVPLPEAFSRRLANDPYFLATHFNNRVPEGDPRTPGRGSNGASPTRVANVAQQKYLIDCLTRAVLPSFVDPAWGGDGKAFAVVYWSRDPDGTQHNELDVADQLVPGINGDTTHRAFQNVDNNLKQLAEYLRTTADPQHPGKMLSDNTDIFITSDHGFSTASRGLLDTQGTRLESYATRQRYSDVRENYLPSGAVAIELAQDLDLPLYDGDRADTANGTVQYRKLKIEGTEGQGNWAGHANSTLLGGAGTFSREKGFDTTFVIVGGTIYMPQAAGGLADAATIALAKKAVTSLSSMPFISGVFVDTQRLGEIPGALSLDDINLRGSARMPIPAIMVNYRTFSTDAADPFMTGVYVAPSGYREGQGTHGTLGRQDTYNCMLAFGPDFKAQFSDPDPVSNADIAQTLGHILGLPLAKQARGQLVGRVISEALAGGPAARGSQPLWKSSPPAPNGKATILQYQSYVDETGRTYRYFDAAGYVGFTNGLQPPPTAEPRAPRSQ